MVICTARPIAELLVPVVALAGHDMELSFLTAAAVEPVSILQHSMGQLQTGMTGTP